MSSNPPGEGAARPVDQSPQLSREELTELTREQMRKSIGGWSGSVIAAVPTVVFVAVNAAASLRTALVAAVASALVLAAYRVVRHEPVQHAMSGLIGVVIAALIANHTGQARGYFLYGIILSFVYFAVLVLSMVVRRPLVGLAWEFIDPAGRSSGVGDRAGGNAPATVEAERAAGQDAGQVDQPPNEAPTPWYRRGDLLRAYQLATGAGAAVFLARGVVQLALYDRNSTGWLAFARIAMGVPLYFVAVAFGVFVVTRARRRISQGAAL